MPPQVQVENQFFLESGFNKSGFSVENPFTQNKCHIYKNKMSVEAEHECDTTRVYIDENEKFYLIKRVDDDDWIVMAATDRGNYSASMIDGDIQVLNHNTAAMYPVRFIQ
jgi:hypothetical protein